MIDKDYNQNFWQLACIAGTALGLPAMVIGGQLAKQYGAGTALVSIVIGNFILWLIGFGVVAMAHNRINAIENVKEYLGRKAGFFAAVVWVCIFLIWYTLQIKGGAGAISKLFQEQDQWWIGVILGFSAAVFAAGGIRLIKWFCVISFPFLICFMIYKILISEYAIQLKGSWGISFPAILSVMLIWLAFGVNLPTFFRHSRSRFDSIFGLSLMTLVHMFFEMFSVFIGISDAAEIIPDQANTILTIIMTMSFIVLSYGCVNFLNIYFTSVAWETLVSRNQDSKQHLIIGILGTGAYVLLYKYPMYDFHYSMEFLEKLLVSFVASLVIVLLMGFLMKIVIRHRLRPLEKLWNSLCWAIGCIAAIVVQTQVHFSSNDGVIAAVVASVLGFLIVIFIEEIIWSIKTLQVKKEKNNIHK